jgi:hypothetical protein
MAMAVIGGLLTSTLLTLLIIPVVYDIVEARREKEWWGLADLVRRLRGKDISKSIDVE